MDDPMLVTALVKFRQDVLLKYYYEYVEGLEKERDELEEQNIMLKRHVTRLKNQLKAKEVPATDGDYQRLRTLAQKLKKERDYYKDIARAR